MRDWENIDVQVFYFDDAPIHEPGRRAFVCFSDGDYEWQEGWLWWVTDNTGAIVVSGEHETEDGAKRAAMETAAALEVKHAD